MRYFLFPCGLFLSAFLLFSIQPMAAKVLLPVYGGTPAVWTICVLFFQAMLLAAYGYAAVLGRCKTTKVWRISHGVVLFLSLATIPVTVHLLPDQRAPEWSILLHLFRSLGAPLLVLGASAPLLQYAYSQTQAKRAADPYFLYSASNFGSLSALLLYPILIERYIGLQQQVYLWSVGYLLYCILILCLLCMFRYHSLAQHVEDNVAPSWSTRFYWVFLSFVPCSLMLGVTLYISTDVAATPLFWVLPLALYLCTFIVAFQTKPVISFTWLARNSMFFLVFMVLGFILNAIQVRVWQTVLFNLSGFFVLALLCHRQLFLSRPKAQRLTVFYFCLALGGVLAGVFNGILAPHWFNQVYEYPLAIVLSVFAIPTLAMGMRVRSLWMPCVVLCIMTGHYFVPNISWPAHFSTFQVSAMCALLLLVVWQYSKISVLLSLLILLGFIFAPALQKDKVMMQVRNFYGVKKVIAKEGVHALISQSTVHGLQYAGQAGGYSAYYGAVKPVIDLLKQETASLPVTIIGLGIGTLACQFRATDTLNIIEIDAQVIEIARNPQFFTYLSTCPASIKIIENDGRLAVEQLAAASQKLLIIDAFNSDAIPIHLITVDAFALYKQKITHDGVILINLSNRHLDLLPVVQAAGRALDMVVFYVHDPGDPAQGQFSSEWALLSMNENLAFKLLHGSRWRFDAYGKEFLWTDDYSNIIPLLKH